MFPGRMSTPFNNRFGAVVFNAPHQPAWETLEVNFVQPRWGVKALQIPEKDGIMSFVYPLIVTEVNQIGEAQELGISVGDQIVDINSIKVRAREDLLELPSQRQFVSNHIQALLNAGGPCTMKVNRKAHRKCKTCASSDLVEIPERGVLICQGCAVEQQSGMSFMGTAETRETEENENAYSPSYAAEFKSYDVTMDFIDMICEKMDLNQSIVAQAKDELRLFYKELNRAGSKKMRCRPFEALAASCVLVVCRFKKIGRTEKEILAVCSCTKRHLAIVLRGVNRVICEMSNRRVPVSCPKDVIERFCANMNADALVVKTATHVVQVGPPSLSAQHH
jgi:transcription initiation factor TFIIIB Brf1 subunit/transcription initiation factor TFIIB